MQPSGRISSEGIPLINTPPCLRSPVLCPAAATFCLVMLSFASTGRRLAKPPNLGFNKPGGGVQALRHPVCKNRGLHSAGVIFAGVDYDV